MFAVDHLAPNTENDTYLIDEPELGISPEVQGILVDFLCAGEIITMT